MIPFRTIKALLRPWLGNPAWSAENPLPPELCAPTAQDAPPNIRPMNLINALFACLPEGSDITDRAAFILGNTLRDLFEENPEYARTVMRRFIWHMNEESGNTGWGIPEAFGAALAASAPLAREYHSILFHYIDDKEGDSTYCDHAPLRRSCFLAIATVIRARPEYSAELRPLLQHAAQNDVDEECRKLATMVCSLLSNI